MYERIVSECKKLRYLVHNMGGRNLTVLSQTEYDNVREEYGIILM